MEKIGDVYLLTQGVVLGQVVYIPKSHHFDRLLTDYFRLSAEENKFLVDKKTCKRPLHETRKKRSDVRRDAGCVVIG